MGDGSVGFALSYAAFHLILTWLWWRTGVYDLNHRPLSQPYSSTFLITSALFIVSIFTYFVAADREAFELPTSTMNHCVLSLVIATLSQHRTDLNKKITSRFRGRIFRVPATCLDAGHFFLIFKQNHIFLWSWRDSTLRPHRCERCVLTN